VQRYARSEQLAVRVVDDAVDEVAARRIPERRERPAPVVVHHQPDLPAGPTALTQRKVAPIDRSFGHSRAPLALCRP
jgi:hypothetical protein